MLVVQLKQRIIVLEHFYFDLSGGLTALPSLSSHAEIAFEVKLVCNDVKMRGCSHKQSMYIVNNGSTYFRPAIS
jgi:hypothetical protein